MKTRDRVRELRALILSAAARSGAREIRVFGSVARGEEAGNSDIDFLVALDPGRTLLDLARLEIKLEELLGRRVEVVTEAALREPIRSAALRDAIHV